MEDKQKEINQEVKELSQEETGKVAGGDIYDEGGRWGDQQAHNIPDFSKSDTESKSKSKSGSVWGGYRDCWELLGAMGDEQAHNIPKFF